MSQKEARFVEDWTKCQNHEKTNIAELLTVPRYVDVMDEDGDASEDKVASATPQSGLVKSCTAWWNEMAKWVQEEQDRSDDDDEDLADVMYSCQCSKWLPRSLDLLFGGQKETDIDE
jgi:hypothetical protein